MYSPLSPNFLRLIRQSGRRKTVADVYFEGALVAENLAVSEGSIRVELDGQVRRSGSVTIADPRLVPTLSNVLSPLGTEIRIRQGIVAPNGSEDLIPLGVFRLDVTSWGEQNKVPQIQLYDRSRSLQVSMPNPTSRAGTLAQGVIIEFLEFFYPGLAPISAGTVFDPDLIDYRLPGGHVFEQDTYWDAAVELAKNMGGRLFFDVDGQPRCEKIVNLSDTSTSVFDVNAGENGVLVSADRTYSREGVFNFVTVVGASNTEGSTPRGVAYNNDLGSPLRYGGPFGKVGMRIEDSSLTSDTQCAFRAQLELEQYTGLSYSVDFSAVPNPALDAGDILRVIYPDGSAERHQLSSFTIPLGKGAFTGGSRGVYLNG